MSRIALPLAVADIAALAHSLRTRLIEAPATPSHLELLNWLAKAAGFKNFQHFRAEARPASPVAPGDAATVEAVALAAPQPRQLRPAPEPVDQARIKRLLRLFDADGRLVRWPSKRGLQLTCLWALWAAIPAREVFDEPGITRLLGAAHDFGDPVLLRRELCDLGLLWRTTDCRAYRRLERKPPPDALELIRRVRAVATARPDTAPQPAPGKEGRHVR
ncbi:MAG: DUF2087 domain-containing protein [Solidesulfovibrio sp.]|uniref:DUF2087 domain-containing protein n=1 Tax=Solidesulfovibrio sp. TaxID=2910990 RepID=UPI002B2079FB|nr:DUF2087 domain-containing protein [Solidesulfovibrio sp.]MEA4857069.1 DUF2087 domain-containing protein [Solidesulfovibrio sp.]